MPTVYLHMVGEDPIVGEVDDLPKNIDTIMPLKNPRRRDGKDIPYLEQNVTQVYIPVHRITLMEVLPGADEDQIISFVRE
jgi:hypothetical protein